MWHVSLGILNRTLRIGTDDEVVARYLHNAFRRLRCEPGETATDDAFIIMRAPEPRVVFGGATLTLAPDRRQTPFSVAFYGAQAILERAFARVEGHVVLRAAAVDCGAGAVAVSGLAGIGKTTLAIELLSRGASFFGDEYVFLREHDNLVTPFLRSLMVREPALALFANDSPIAKACRRSAWRRTAAYRIWDYIDPVEAFGAGAVAQPSRLRAAILLERGHRTHLAPLSASVYALSAVPHLGSLDRAWRLTERLREVRCYRLTMKDVPSAAQLVQDVALTAC